ncbi:MAG: acyltransferase [Actinomycetota bacterium]|nr:acyltransferase [Actinomycetota bacterium]
MRELFEGWRTVMDHPRVFLNAWKLKKSGVELGAFSWIEGNVKVYLAARSGVRIGKRVFIPRDIEILGNDDGKIIIGDDVSIDSCARFHVANQATLQIGNKVGVGAYDFLDAFDDLTIGENTMLGPFLHVICADHGVKRDIPMREQRGTYAPISIGKDCWIGSEVVVLKGVTIGDGAVVGAGSVVTKDIPEYCIAAGVPARVLKERPS